MHDHPSPLTYLAAIAAGTAVACWVARREGSRICRAVRAPRSPERDMYWRVYADVLDDLGGVGSGRPTR